MFARGFEVLECAEHGLGGELFGMLAMEAHAYASINEGFDHEEGIGGSATTEGGRHVDVGVFLVDEEFFSEGGEHLTGLFALLTGDLGRRRPDSHALPYLRGRVGHGANDARIIEGGGDGLDGDTGSDADDEGEVAGLSFEVGEDVGHDLGLDGEHEYLSAPGRLYVVGVVGDAEFIDEALGFGSIGVGEGDLGGCDVLLLEDTAYHRATHRTATDESYGRVLIEHGYVLILSWIIFHDRCGCRRPG